MDDHGICSRYAGPVRRTTTNADCVVGEGSMIYEGQYIVASTGKIGCPLSGTRGGRARA